MADVTFTMSASEAKAVRAFQKVIDKQRGVAAGARETGRASRQAATEAQSGTSRMSAGFARVSGSVRGVIGGLIGVGGLVQAFRLASAEAKKTGEAAVATLSKMQGVVAGAGDIAAFSEISRGLRSTTAPGSELLSMKQRTAVYGAIRGSMPLAPRGKVMDLTSEAMGFARIYPSMEDTTRAANVMGELAKIKPEATPDDLADISVYLTQAAGKHGRQLDKRAFKAVRQLTAAGVKPDKAVATLVASMEAGQGGEALTSLASWIVGGRKGRLAPSALAVQEQMKRRDYVGEVARVQREDIFAGQARVIGRDADLQRLSFFREVEAEESLLEYDERKQALMHKSARKFTKNLMRQRGVSAARRWLNVDVGMEYMEALGASPEGALGWMPSGTELQRRWRGRIQEEGLGEDSVARDLRVITDIFMDAAREFAGSVDRMPRGRTLEGPMHREYPGPPGE